MSLTAGSSEDEVLEQVKTKAGVGERQAEGRK